MFLFFCFVGCDSVFLEYSRIDIFASLELLLTFCYSDWSTSLGFSLLYSRMCVEIISLLKLGDSMVEIIFCFVCHGFSPVVLRCNFFFVRVFSLCRISGFFRLAVFCLAAPVNL